MAKRLTEADVRREIAELETKDIKSLQTRWRDLFKVPTPRGIRAPFLRRAIAYRLQEQVHGGLSSATKRQLRKIAAADHAARIDGTVSDRHSSRARQIKLSPGTQLVREWDGQTEVVDVVRGGYVWCGKTYSTLSAVASAITGTRWSGPRFFGLTAPRAPITQRGRIEPAGNVGNDQTEAAQ